MSYRRLWAMILASAIAFGLLINLGLQEGQTTVENWQSCLPQWQNWQFERIESIASTIVQNRVWQYLELYQSATGFPDRAVVSWPVNEEERCRTDFIDIASTQRSLTQASLPRSVGRTLVLQLYRRQIQRTSRAQLQESIDQLAQNPPHPDFKLPAGEVWALQQVGIEVDDRLQP